MIFFLSTLPLVKSFRFITVPPFVTRLVGLACISQLAACLGTMIWESVQPFCLDLSLYDLLPTAPLYGHFYGATVSISPRGNFSVLRGDGGSGNVVTSARATWRPQ